MPIIDWNIVSSILTALGIFELLKRTLLFWFENNVVKQNLETREIAERAMRYCNDLKLRNFEAPLSLEETRQLRLDITKVDSWNKKLGDELMILINYPWMIKMFHDNSLRDTSGEYQKLMTKYHTELHSKVDKLVPTLNKLRYKPIFEIKKFQLKLKNKIYNWLRD